MKIENLIRNVSGFKLGPINLEVDSGYVIAVIGRNGSGKSTLFECILGFQSCEGNIDLGVEQKEIAFILEKSLFPDEYSAAQIAMCYGPLYPEFDKEHFYAVCRQYHIPLWKQMRKLSKGMSLMVQYAFASSYPAKLLILDEPSAHMDTWARKDLYDMVSTFTENEGTVLWASHVGSELDKMADYVLGLKNGKAEFFMEKEKLAERYIKVSGSKSQMDAMRRALVGRKDTEVNSIGLVDKEMPPVQLYGCQEPADMADFVEFVL